MWLGLLFSVLAITMLSYNMLDEEPPEYEGISEALLDLYRLRTAQCLIMGDIAKCLPYTLETLIHYASAEYSRKDDNGRGQWMMASVIVRAAINMGYHREPSQSSSISVLQAELRRRIWSCAVSIDNKSSFLAGFPSMMPSIDSDTLEPRNLHDWELSDDTTVLPPSRALNEYTPVTYLIVKEPIISAVGRISDFNNTLNPGSYDKVLELDRSLHEAFEKAPPHMKVHSPDSASSPQSKSAATVAILQMEFLYHQGMCALHRKFLAKGRLDSRYSLSRNRCISSALALLAHQHALHQGTRAKTESSMPYWYQARHYFILAAMILCLDLEHRRRGEDQDTVPDFGTLLQALERSCTIWKGVQGCSDEAQRVYNVLTSMLLSFGSDAGASQAKPTQLEVDLPGSTIPFETFKGSLEREDVFETSNDMDIDWVGHCLLILPWSMLTFAQATWDSFIEGTSFEDAYQEMTFDESGLDGGGLPIR
jgi:hypothetical protein